LYETRTFQARFIAVHLEHTLEKMSVGCKRKKASRAQLFRVANTSTVSTSDYLALKAQDLFHEQYQGEGWGLKQVLLGWIPKAPFLLVKAARAAHSA
jgi:hypothetical protein